MTYVENSERNHSTASLSRRLGVWSIVFMVVAAAAPLGAVAATFPIVISLGGNLGGPLLFLAAALLLGLFAVGYTKMARYVPGSGAFYSYIQAGCGRVIGTGAATLAFISYLLLLIAITAYFAVNLGIMVDTYFQVDLPWWFWMLVGFVVTGYLGYRNIELSAKVLGIALISETLIVVIMDVAILLQGGNDGFSTTPLSPAEAVSGTPGLGLMFAFFCFFGFEATAVFRGEAVDPRRTIPRATYVALAFIGVFYAFSMYCVIIGAGVDHAIAASENDAEMVLNLASVYVAPIMKEVMLVLLVTSQFACTLSIHNVVTRYQFAMGEKTILPRWVGSLSSKHLTPSRSSATVTVFSLAATLVVAAMGLEPIDQVYAWLSGAATLGVILMMALTGAAVIVFFGKNDLKHGRWATVFAPALSTIGLFGVLAILIKYFDVLTGGITAVAVGFIAVIILSFAIGVIVAQVMRSRRPDEYERLMDPPDLTGGQGTPLKDAEGTAGVL